MTLPRPRPHHLVLAGLLALFGLVSILLAPPEGSGTREGGKPSSFNGGDGGLRALSLTCEGVGIAASPWTGRMETLGPDDGPLVVVDAPGTEPPGPHLLLWVRGGGRLLVASTDPGSGLLGIFDLRTVALAAGRVRADPGAGWTLPDGPAEAAAGFAEETLPPGAEVLARAAGSGEAVPLAVAVPVGAGEVVALADASFLQNRRFGEEACALLAVRLAERVAGGEGRIRFCETIHGYGASGQPSLVLWRILAGTAPGRAILGAASFVLLLLASGAVRFRRVRRTLEPPRRSEYEYLDALAGLLHHERAWRRVGDLLLQGIRRRLGGLDPGGSRLAEKELAARIAWDRPGEEGAAEEDLRVLASGTDGARDPGGMAAALARLDARVREDRSRLGAA